MRRLLLPIVISLLLLLTGCEFFEDIPKPRVHFVSMAFGYYGTKVLKGPVNDQSCLYEEFKAMYEDAGYEFSASMVNDKNHKVWKKTLLNGTETETQISASASTYSTAFSSLLPDLFEDENIGEDDITIFFYSGHGGNGTGALLGPDLSESYSVSELLALIQALPGYKLIILDSCFAGKYVFSEEADSSVLDAYSSLFSSKELELNYTWGIYACEADEEAQEFNSESALNSLGWLRPHGAFTAALLLDLGMDLATEEIGIPNKAVTVNGMYSSSKSRLADSNTVLGVSTYHTPTDSWNFFDLVLYAPGF